MGIQLRERTQAYVPLLDQNQTSAAVKVINESLSSRLSEILNLTWVPAPQAVVSGLGINDDLNSVERAVSFEPPSLGGLQVEVVQSLAKWKRVTLARVGKRPGEGIYADLNAIRPDEECGPLHSLTVDQWEWERCISKGDRTVAFLQKIVGMIYESLRDTEKRVSCEYPVLGRILPDRLTFLHAEDLRARYPCLSPREREDRVAEQFKAVFIIGIGAPLSDGVPHDGRAPDYDDWTTPNGRGSGLNGDLVVWHPVLNQALELSSMGIRVNRRSLLRQLELRGKTHWKNREFHRNLLAGKLPQTIGGGIGKSRLCMYLLRKAHIGEVQASVWSESIRRDCFEKGIPIL